MVKWRLSDAEAFATKAHHGALRKGTRIPYIVHPRGVAVILKRMGARKEVVAAGWLHDTVEDAGVTIAQLRQRFGRDVATLVAAVSEDKRKSWKARKTHTILSLPKARRDVLWLTFADKLDNLRWIKTDFRRMGDRLWARFNGKSKHRQAWYYGKLAEVFARRRRHGRSSAVFNEFARLEREVFAPLPPKPCP